MKQTNQEALGSLKRRIQGQLEEFFDSAIVLGIAKDPTGVNKPQLFGLCFYPRTEGAVRLDEDGRTLDDISEVAEPVRQILLAAVGDPGNPSAKEFRLITLALWDGIMGVMGSLLEGVVNGVGEDDDSDPHWV